MYAFIYIVSLIVQLPLIILGAEAFFSGLLGAARRIGVSTFFLTLLISGLEIENIAAGLAANLPRLDRTVGPKARRRT